LFVAFFTKKRYNGKKIYGVFMFNIVLVEPEIPQNTGNIVRTCAATGCKLHLVRPLGFEVSDKYLKRAGLDYWHYVDITYYDSFDEVLAKNPQANFYYFTTKARKRHCDVAYKENDFLVFGKETKGLPEELLVAHPDSCVRIPMIGELRSLNLSNSVAIAVYEALRQQDFKGFNTQGQLHRLKWE
jgi:tRNA (cytidine/uridine-2'-O-)-methyltransferase